MRKLAMWLLGSALLMAALPQVGSANGVSVTAFGGTIIPTGTFGDENHLGAKVGYQFGGSLDFAAAAQFAIGVDGSFNKDKGQLDGTTIDLGGGDSENISKAEFSTVQAGVHGKYLIPAQGPVHPFVLLGLGVYRVKYAEEGEDVIGGVSTPFSSEVSSDTKFGGKLGVGGTWAFQPSWGISAEADYNLITADKNKGLGVSSLQYLGVTAGLTWMMPAGTK